MRRVLVFDTSILCVWLQVPGKESCGAKDSRWDHQRVTKLIQDEIERRSTFVLPLASIIETGNHISQASRRRFETAQALMELLQKTLDEEEPWAAFSQQEPLWQGNALHRLIEDWPKRAAEQLSIGDATIKDVADFYARMGEEVEIVTGDRGLKAYQPAKPPRVPRRRY